MKKTILIAAILLGAALSARAVPAWPGKYQYRQPDGSIIVLQNHGDEDYHWTTDEQGRVVELFDDGFYRIVMGGEAAVKAGIRRSRGVGRRGRWASYEEQRPSNFGNKKVLCILAQFQDVKFSAGRDPEQEAPADYDITLNGMFSNMLNMHDYSYDGAIGSVRDYYLDNSRGQYSPSFDVLGPVTLPENMAYYGANTTEVGGSDIAPERALYDALVILLGQNPDLNLSPYDSNGDGVVDMTLFYFAGYSEAEGGPANAIWPHQWSLKSSSIADVRNNSFNGKSVGTYFCTAELLGNSGNNMCAIGTTCHEFAHSLGLPDFYDTDYEKSGNKMIARSTGRVDLMASGNYNDGGRKPPYLSALERNMLGWMPAPVLIDASGNYELLPVQENAAYMSLSKTKGEYFIYEYRNGAKWDGGIVFEGQVAVSTGMIYYRVDKSDNIVSDSGHTAAYLWENTNKINAYGGHACYRIEKPFAAASSWPELFLPATNHVNNELVDGFTPRTWAGEDTGLEFSKISIDGVKATFTATYADSRWLRGTVTDGSDNPIEGATVTLSRSQYALNSAHHLSGDVTAVTDASGKYELAFAYSESANRVLTVRKDGYAPSSENYEATARYLFHDVVLVAAAAPTFSDLGVAQAKVEGEVLSAVPAGDKTVNEVLWYVDGVAVGETAPALSNGTHTYKVVFTYYDGSSERVILDVTR